MIRDATLEDIPTLLEMSQRFYYKANWKRYATFEDALGGITDWYTSCINSERLYCSVAEVDGEIVGFLNGVLSEVFWTPDVLCAHETVLWVEPKARNAQVGSKLLSAFTVWAGERGAKLVAAGSTQAVDPKAVGGVLRRLGFTLEEKIYVRTL